MSRVQSPFKFLDSYQEADAAVFFGREEETTNLYKALSGVKHLLLYGPSGSGKTSLVECGLRNRFSDADWFALTIRKGANINASLFAAINKALSNTINVDLANGLPVDGNIEFAEAVDKLFKERFQPIYLLFDQFEELLISGDAAEKRDFFTGLNKLIRNKVPCRILLIMREEFIGHLSEFESLCPSIFQHRFRVEKMGRKNVEEVIFHILEAPGYRSFFKVDDSRALTEAILSKLPDKKKEIELAHVQVFLAELWDRSLACNTGDGLPVLSAALIHDTDDLEGILESFLKKQMTELDAVYGERITLELLAVMISEKFTKLQLSGAAIKTELEQNKVQAKKPIEALLNELEQRRIIRPLKAGDETQYEISHDVLALVVGQNLTDEMKMREKAADIYKVFEERKGLFTQDDIDYLRPFQQNLPCSPGLQQRIDKSVLAIKQNREAELAKTRKRLRVVYSLLGLAFLALVTAIFFWLNANKQARIAKANSLIFAAQSLATVDPPLALRLAEAAYNMNDDSVIAKAELQIYRENTFYRIFVNQKSDINIAAYSQDDKTIFVSSDSNAYLKDLDGKTIQNFRGHTGGITSVAFSADNNYILTGSFDSTARLWNMKGDMLHTFRGHTNVVYSVAFSPDGRSVITGSDDGTVILWSLQGDSLYTFRGHDGTVTSVCFSPNGKYILSGCKDDTARLWDLNGKLTRIFPEADEINCVAFSPDGKMIATASEDFSAHLWDLNGKSLQQFTGQFDALNSVAFSPDGQTILTGSSDNKARLWDLNGRILEVLYGHTEKLFNARFSHDGKKVITSSADNTVRLWELKSATLKELKGHKKDVFDAKYSPDGKYLLTASDDGTALLWDLKTGETIASFPHKDEVATAVFSPDGQFILTASKDSTVCVWNRKGICIQRFIDTVHKAPIRSAVFSPSGKNILTCSSDDSVARMWDMSGNIIQSFTGHKGDTGHTSQVCDVAFSPNGLFVLTGSDDGTAILWNLNGEIKQRFKTIGKSYGIKAVAFSPDGTKILTACDDNMARLWDLKGNMIRVFEGHVKGVYKGVFSKDGTEILTASDDNTARLWDLKGNTLQEFKASISHVNAVAFSPDGKTIVTGSSDNITRFWNIGQSVNEFLKSNKIEPLTPEQKKQYGIK
jgi:WD40 repeat protein